MSLMIPEVHPDAAVGEYLSIEALCSVIPPQTVEAVVGECGARERRSRKLPASVTVLLCVAMGPYAADALPDVFRRLVWGLRWLWPEPGELRVSKAAASSARYRLGARPLARLFRAVCRPLATPATPGAFRFGLRLLALDGFTLDLADTPENVRAFGRRYTDRGECAWPQARVVALSECGTRAYIDAGVWRHDADERACGRRLLRSAGRGVLLLWDRGFHSREMIAAALGRGAHVLGRLPATVKPELVRTLPDGTRIVRLRPADPRLRRTGMSALARLIRYTIDDPNRVGHGEEHRLVTTLLDPERAPAEELALCYHERREFELGVDELKAHQRTPKVPLRSKRPVGVIQEVYGLLLAHYVVRAVALDAAEAADLPPDRLSFATALRVVREAVPEFVRTHPSDHPRIYAQLLADIAALPLPPRANRAHPRVVKKKMSSYGVKKPRHRHPPQPAKPFPRTIVMLK